MSGVVVDAGVMSKGVTGRETVGVAMRVDCGRAVGGGMVCLLAGVATADAGVVVFAVDEAGVSCLLR